MILDGLPPAVRDRLIEERTLGGAGTGKSYSAASVVSDGFVDKQPVTFHEEMRADLAMV